ncbi:hypothetical protein Nepgr_015885 [Nepenthes gracilis]|uniref:Uncharacterized protein n=1 Tax=Nepenthes gracilis TaxID=150966 RepID=A0AAD3SNK3_NEPGR|nr:hypothetical protein Nepgr_015885 [Nepenthes gracilis]
MSCLVRGSVWLRIGGCNFADGNAVLFDWTLEPLPLAVVRFKSAVKLGGSALKDYKEEFTSVMGFSTDEFLA